MFSKKATKIDKTFTVDLTLCIKCQIDSEDLINFCGLLRKHELYDIAIVDTSNLKIVNHIKCSDKETSCPVTQFTLHKHHSGFCTC